MLEYVAHLVNELEAAMSSLFRNVPFLTSLEVSLFF
jgi:hypothetical protein